MTGGIIVNFFIIIIIVCLQGDIFIRVSTVLNDILGFFLKYLFKKGENNKQGKYNKYDKNG